jgi:hypothetical protein
VLLAFADGHPALDYLLSAGFEWPFLEEWEPAETDVFELGSVKNSPLGLPPPRALFPAP